VENTQLSRLLPLPVILDLTSLSESTIRREVERGAFPRPVKAARDRIAWREPEVRAWLASREVA
jgi:prophage regulatory protein